MCLNNKCKNDSKSARIWDIVSVEVTKNGNILFYQEDKDSSGSWTVKYQLTS